MKEDGRRSERERHQKPTLSHPEATLDDIDPERADRAFGRLLALWHAGMASGPAAANGSGASRRRRAAAVVEPDPQLIAELLESGLVEPVAQPERREPRAVAGPVSLTTSGVLVCQQVLRFAEAVLTDPPLAESPVRPRWDAAKRELSVRGVLVRRFRRTAVNQQLILSAFEELSWPGRIDDPLPPDPFMLASARMHDTIKWLNRGLYVPWFRFHADGSAHGIRWRVIRQLATDSAKNW